MISRVIRSLSLSKQCLRRVGVQQRCHGLLYSSNVFLSVSLTQQSHQRFSFLQKLENEPSIILNDVQKIQFMKAQCFFRQDNFYRALEYLEEIDAGQTCKDIETLKTLARANIALGQFSKGFKIFQRVIAIDPSDIEANVVSMSIVEQVEEYSNEEQNDITDAFTERILEHHKEEAGQKIAMAFGNLLEGDILVVEALLQKPEDFVDEKQRFMAYSLLKEVLFRLGKIGEAISLLEKSLENLTEKREEIHFQLAKLYSQQKDTASEKLHLQKAIAINESQFDIITELAWLAQNEGDQAAAASYFSAAESLEKNYSKIYFYKARIHQQASQLDEAEAMLQTCMEVNQQLVSPLVLNQLGVLQLQRGQFKTALEYFFKALDENNEEAMYYFNIALAYKLSRDSTKALAYYEKGLLLQPTNANMLVDKAKLLCFMKRTPEAIQNLKAALKISPNNTSILMEIARAYISLGDQNNLVKTLNEIIKIDPQHKEAIDMQNDILDKID